MKISKPCMVEIDYELRLDSGEVFDASEEGQALEILVGAGQIIPGLEKALEGKKVGDEFETTIDAADGYGEPHEEMVKTLDRADFPPDVDLEPGTMFEAQGPHGPMPFAIKEVREDKVVVDFNHPLAGKSLTFKVKVTAVRKLTDDEVKAMKAATSHGSCCSSCSSCDSDGCGSGACDS